MSKTRKISKTKSNRLKIKPSNRGQARGNVNQQHNKFRILVENIAIKHIHKDSDKSSTDRIERAVKRAYNLCFQQSVKDSHVIKTDIDYFLKKINVRFDKRDYEAKRF